MFDLGGVLIDWDPRHLYRKVFDDAAEMEWFLAEVCSPEWNRQQDAGRPFAEAVAAKQAEHPNCREAIAAYFERWPEMLGGVNEDTLEVLRAVRATGRRFYALTNWSHETFPVARRRYEFLSWFHGIVVSGEERLAKPDGKIFQRLLGRYALVPSRTVFIDDSRANVESAIDQGMIGLHFTDAATLRGDLLRLGVV
ncbi:MAG TPA: HAD family phosphatase [Burkholderiaceae bacterium]|nr:HAD family phosphatase [Burkholderiaceae bacterium]